MGNGSAGRKVAPQELLRMRGLPNR